MTAYAWEVEEHRAALAALTELDRAAACTHTELSRRGVCRGCGDKIGDER